MSGETRETREHTRTPGPSASSGRSMVYILCPFCGVETAAYLWSLAGVGRRCQCGAKHTSYGTTWKDTP
jgi:hypothetical protein